MTTTLCWWWFCFCFLQSNLWNSYSEKHMLENTNLEDKKSRYLDLHRLTSPAPLAHTSGPWARSTLLQPLRTWVCPPTHHLLSCLRVPYLKSASTHPYPIGHPSLNLFTISSVKPLLLMEWATFFVTSQHFLSLHFYPSIHPSSHPSIYVAVSFTNLWAPSQAGTLSYSSLYPGHWVQCLPCRCSTN